MIVEFKDVELAYGRGWSLSGLNLAVPAGDFLGIVGPNGSGKTTILKAMLGITRPRRGELRRAGGIRFGYVPQRQHIDEVYPLAALDVVLMGRFALMGPLGRPTRKDRDQALESLEHVGLSEMAGRPYRDLSGGQKQRVLIARALAGEPHVLVLDEPTNDMDIAGETATMNLIRHFHDEHGLTVVMVTHLLNVVADYARTIALIDGGRLIIGATEDVLSPGNLSTVYGTEVGVAEIGGRRVVVAGGPR